MRVHVSATLEGGFKFLLHFDGLHWSTGLISRKEYTTRKAARRGAKRLIQRMEKIDWLKVELED